MYYMSMNQDLILKQLNAKKIVYNINNDIQYYKKTRSKKYYKDYNDYSKEFFEYPGHIKREDSREKDAIIAELKEEIEELKLEIETLKAMGQD